MSAPASPGCYLRGTKIATSNGECKIEDLKIGDQLITHNGSIRPVKWVGRMSYNKGERPWLRSVLPVLISKGALGKGLPHQDLFVSQRHEMFIDGVLVMAKQLLNGTTIRLSAQMDATVIQYFHVMLETHDAILAEGQPAETLRSGAADREKFENFAEYLRLYPNDSKSNLKRFAPFQISFGQKSFGMKFVVGKKTTATVA